MDDLSGLDWNVSSNNSSSIKPPPLSNANNFPSLRPTPPLSGRSTPSTLQPQTAIGKPPATPGAPSKTSTPQNDSFASLLPFNAAQTSKNLSLKEQQELLQEQKKKQTLNDHKQWDTYFGGSTSAGTSAQPSRTASPSGLGYVRSQSSGQKALDREGNAVRPSRLQASQSQQEEDDLLAAFNFSAPVDASSHFPVPTQSRSSSGVPSIPPAQSSVEPTQSDFIDDDDPFGLGTTSVPPTCLQTQKPQPTRQVEDDDDVLGLLGKPVSELPPKEVRRTPPPVAAEGHPVDKAIAELVDMGFPAEKARVALVATDSGIDVQAAVGLLLNQAHAKSRSKSQTPLGSEAEHSTGDQLGSESNTAPAWMRQKSRPNASRQHSENSKSAGAERDAGKYASELGNNFFKTANSLWKTGQKKLTKAVSDFNTDTDPSQPKWMKEVSTDREAPTTLRRESTTNGKDPRSRQPPTAPNMTDEAVLLEMGRERPQPAKSRTSRSTSRAIPHAEPSRTAADDDLVRPRQAVQHHTTNTAQPRSKPTRKMNEEEEVQAYISPARRKKAPPKPQMPEPDLLSGVSAASKPAPSLAASTSTPSPLSQRPAITKPSAPLPSRPKAPPRNVPSLSSISFQSSTSHRIAGTSAFKLGNYGEAASSYTFALRDLPQSHPLTIVLLTNRALTHLKNGDPKQCIVDADTALQVIGPSRGMGENIDIGGDEGKKDMAPYWGKAMMRRAEALEQLERLADAAKVWKECVEAGVGGSTSIQGRNRCEKAAGISNPASQPTSRKSTPAPRKPAPKSAVSRTSALDDLSGRPSLPHAALSEAVTRLRAANEAAAKVDDEKFALGDSVTERVDQWRKGKESNLRALLGSLDTVLWADSGWKKVNMSELLNPSKVKLNYMKGIAKVHPDKVRQNHP